MGGVVRVLAGAVTKYGPTIAKGVSEYAPVVKEGAEAVGAVADATYAVRNAIAGPSKGQGGGSGGGGGGGDDSNFATMLTSTGAKVVSELSKGVSSAMGSVGKVGADLGGLLIEHLTSFLGQSGQGIKQAVGGVFQGVVGIAGQAFGTMSDLLQGGLKIVTSLASTASGAVGSAFKVGFAIIGSIAEMAGQLVSRLGEAIGALGQAVGQVISGIVSVLQDCVNTARKMSTDILSIRNNTGMSTGAAATTYSGLRAVGVSANTITSMYSDPSQSPAFLEMKARAYGITAKVGTDEFNTQLATTYQQKAANGPLGLMDAQGMMKSMGMANPEMIKMVSTPVEQLRANQEFNNTIQKDLGLSPAAIERIGERLGLLFQRFEIFAENAKAKIVEGLLPTLEAGFEAATNFVANNAGKIAEAIQVAMEWTYAVLPKLILNGASAALGAIANIMRGLGEMLNQFGQGNGILNSILRPLAKAWDFAADILRGIGATIAAITNPLDRGAYSKALKNMPASHMEDDLDSLQSSGGPQKLGNGLMSMADSLDLKKNNIDSYNNNVLGSEEDRKNDLKGMLERLQSIDKSSSRTAEATEKQNNTGPTSAGEFHARAYMEQMIVQGMRRARTR